MILFTLRCANNHAFEAWFRDGGGFDQTRQTASIGYDYPLSKRTDIYAAYMYDHISSMSSGNTYGVGLRAKF